MVQSFDFTEEKNWDGTKYEEQTVVSEQCTENRKGEKQTKWTENCFSKIHEISQVEISVVTL